MSPDAEMVELARAVEAYDTRLQLMPSARHMDWFRREVEALRHAAAARLAELEAERGEQSAPAWRRLLH
jgi:hypothetical protein